jgi:lactose/L-arabinose transport system ATP-binding protein
MRIEIARLHRELGNTMIYVTHDQTEAMTLADKIVVLRDGRIEQTGTPREIYENPHNIFVAGFIGSPRMNLLKAEWSSDNVVRVGGYDIPAPIAAAKSCGTEVTFGIRPEHLNVVDGSKEALPAQVEFSEYLGGTQYLYCRLDDGQSVTVEYRQAAPIKTGDAVFLSCQAHHRRFFDGDGVRLP